MTKRQRVTGRVHNPTCNGGLATLHGGGQQVQASALKRRVAVGMLRERLRLARA